MNSNRNNRRRGRGNRNHSGGNAANRIDSRARGNAPQLLDKYKKLAQDAQHNGDRVQAEYYLQFADHYFRVISDNKIRQEEARAKRQQERGDQYDDDGDENEDGGNRRPQRGRGRRGDNRNDDIRNENRDDDNDERKRRGRRGDNAPQDDASSDDNDNDDAVEQERKPRRTRAPRSKSVNGAAGEGDIDASVLPPAIGAGDEDEAKPKRAPRRRKSADEAEASAAE